MSIEEEQQKNILEIYGLGNLVNPNQNHNPDPDNQYSNQNYSSGLNNNRPNYELPEFKKSKPDLEGTWQGTLRDNIIKGLDNFVSVPPSAGKTLPVKEATKQLFLDFFKKKGQLPFMLYVVPRKQLAAQINHNDIQEMFLEIIADQRSLDNNNPDKIPLFDTAFTNKSDVDLFLANLVIEIVGGGGGSNLRTGYSIFNNRYPFVIATYEPAMNIVRSYGNQLTHIIVDEVQELIPHPGEELNEGLSKRYTSLITILNEANRSTSVSLMTGSVNNITVGSLIDYFNKKYKRDFKPVPQLQGDITRLNRSEIVLQPLQSLAGFPNKSVPRRLALAKEIVVNKQSNSIMIIFSKQRSGQGIFRMIEDLIKVLPPKPISYFYDNSRPPTEDTVDNFIQDKIDKKYFKSASSQNIDDIEYLKYFNILDHLNNSNKSEEELLNRRNRDENNPLYQGVLRGFAPMMGSMPQIHKRVIQNLFIKKKIQLLFATDALGVGANVKCRYLYIPTIDKFDGKGLSRTDESSLTQLVHRAGRGGDITVANVYCAIQDYDYIHNLIYNDPRTTVPKINPLVLNDLFSLEVQYGESFISKILAKAIFVRNR